MKEKEGMEERKKGDRKERGKKRRKKSQCGNLTSDLSAAVMTTELPPQGLIACTCYTFDFDDLTVAALAPPIKCSMKKIPGNSQARSHCSGYVTVK